MLAYAINRFYALLKYTVLISEPLSSVKCELHNATTYHAHVLVASLVQRSGVELQPDDRKYDDGEQHQQANLEERSHGLDDGLQHDLQTYTGEREKNDEGLHQCTPDGDKFLIKLFICLRLVR